MDWLARCITEFRRRYPEVEFEMRTCTADVTGDRLEQGLADLGLVTEPLDVSRYDYLRTHIDDRWGILMRSDDPLSTLNEIRPEDLAGRALVLPFRDEVRGELVSWMGGSLRAVSTAGLCDLSINVMAMVRGGVGLAMSFGLGVPDDLRFKPLSPVLESGGAVIWKRGRTLTPAAAAFVEFLRTEGRDLESLP